MIIGFATDIIPCYIFKFLLSPTVVHNATFLIISVDKVIAITYPLIFLHVVAAMLLLCMLVDGYIKVAHYGTCISIGSAFIKVILTYVLPIFCAAFLSLFLTAYPCIKAYKVHRTSEGSSTMLRL